MRFFLLVLLMIISLVGEASAQVMDMRAFSRQRGFKAYQAPAVPVMRSNVSMRSGMSQQNAEKKVQSETEQDFAMQDQPEQEPSQIHQKGIKIFQEKDENKVMNFNIENPEFNKLKEHQQRDLMNRITFE